MATNYVQDDTGAKFIPATQRPDGTWRKARRVKDGYVPQEEMPLYESKGKQWAKNKPTLPPGLHPDDVARIESMRTQGCLPSPLSVTPSHGNSQSASQTNSQANPANPPNPLHGLSKSAKKNAKRKEKKKEKQNLQKSQNSDDAAVVEKMREIHISNNDDDINVSENIVTNSVQSAETTKRLKNLKKKLREIEILKEKIKCGELPKPDSDQVEKINRQKQIEKEIEELELADEN